MLQAIRPFVICNFDISERFADQEVPEPAFGWFTGEVDSWGKHTFMHLHDFDAVFDLSIDMNDGTLTVGNLPHYRKLYLFADEIGEIHYQDEVSRGA